jgi:hypothetical protein
VRPARGRAVERADDLLAALRAVLGLLGEAPHDHRGERRRRVGAQRQEVGRRLDHVRHEELVRRAGRERRPPGEQLERHRAPRVQVGPVVGGGVAGALFGRHVRGGA